MPPFPPAISLARDVAAGRVFAEEACRAALERIGTADGRWGAFLQRTDERALEQARALDQACRRGDAPGPLAGVPVAVKDNICTRFGRTTCGSKMLARYRSPFSATVVERLEAAGGIVVGKTNLDEFAMGSSTENSAFQLTRNPWDETRVPGGSSGGSAVAVATRMTPLALGSDTGGSVRQPAALTGVVGLKPTYGRVSRYGLVAYGSSLDQIGVLSTCVEDAALLLGVIAGHDAADSTSVDRPVESHLEGVSDAALAARPKLRIGIVEEYLGEGLDDEVRQAVLAALDVYRRLGADVRPVSLPHARHCIATYYIVAMAECSSNLARFDGVHFGSRAAGTSDVYELYAASRAAGFGPEVKRRIILGTFVLSSGYYDEYYGQALKVRRLIKEDYDRAFETVDVLICPTSPTPAFRLGEKLTDPLQMYLADAYTLGVNLAGVPAVSIPCGFTRGGLPLGMQLIGPHFGETGLLQAARLYERETDWHTRVPPGAA
ncbi:MAG: Asp-tRNA(Asn)/Glu-tRNA(Gln) amidotransferase subunit GatA [Phycisphaerae bacterium]|jgi:aspartyl-tRNA(Asn)/glutamyl-tRNA(Gln) amidotransferase subunit A